MPDDHGRLIDELMEQLVAQGPGGAAAVFTRLSDPHARRAGELPRRQNFERNDDLRGYANSVKAQRLD